LSGRGFFVGLISRSEESYLLWCVVVCDLETSKCGDHCPRWAAAPIMNISSFTRQISRLRKLSKVRPEFRWKDDGQNHTIKVEIINWRQVAQDRNGWKRETTEALNVLGECSPRRRRRT